MKAKTLSLCAVVMMGLLFTQGALAKGPPQKVTISGGALMTEIVLTGDQPTLDALGFMALEDYTTLTAEAPPGIGASGYLITRYYEYLPDQYVAFDQLIYYPNPDGGMGYLYYAGIVNGSSDYDNHWFRPVAANEAVLKSVIATGEGASAAARAALLNAAANLIAFFAR